MKYFYYSILAIAVISSTACSTPTTTVAPVSENNKPIVETKEKGLTTEGFLDYNFNSVRRTETQQYGQDNIGKWHNIMGAKTYDCKWKPSAMEIFFAYFNSNLGTPKC